MGYRIVQWATGNLGRAAIEAITSHPQLELVGVWVHSREKVGRDAGELCGIQPLGITATGSIDEVIALAPDCVCYAPLLPDENEVTALLGAGINVVTPLNWFYPTTLDTSAVDAACASGRATLHGTGIHPGGMTERIPIVLSAFSREITHVRSEEFSDVRTYGAPDVLHEIMLFGKTPEEARDSAMLGFLSGGFRQSIHMVADTLGFRLDPRIGAEHDIAVATAPIDSPLGVLAPGLVCAQRFRWTATVDDVPVITVSVHWLMGHENYDAAWLPQDTSERYELEVSGDPSVKSIIHGIHPDASSTLSEVLRRNPGMVATAVHCVSAIPYVCAAEAGIKTYLDLPPVAGRAAPHLARGAS